MFAYTSVDIIFRPNILCSDNEHNLYSITLICYLTADYTICALQIKRIICSFNWCNFAK